MKSVVVVGSIARNSKVLVNHVLDDLSSKYDYVYVSKSFFDCKLHARNIIWITGKGNIVRRLLRSNYNPFLDYCDICVLPCHGQLVVHEIAALLRSRHNNFLSVKSDYTTHRVITKDELLDLFSPNKGSDPLIIN